MNPNFRSHKDVEFHIFEVGSDDNIQRRWDKACEAALSHAYRTGQATIDVVILSEDGARFWGGDNAADHWLEDPDNSVFERLEIKLNNCGRIA